MIKVHESGQRGRKMGTSLQPNRINLKCHEEVLRFFPTCSRIFFE